MFHHSELSGDIVSTGLSCVYLHVLHMLAEAGDWLQLHMNDKGDFIDGGQV